MPDAEIVTALDGLIVTLDRTLGWQGLAALVVLAVLWFLYSEYRASTETDELVAEKERTIQRLAAECREYRMLVYKHVLKMTDDQIDRVVARNEPMSPADFHPPGDDATPPRVHGPKHATKKSNRTG